MPEKGSVRRSAGIRAFLCVGMGHVHVGRGVVGWVLLACMIVLFFVGVVAWTHHGTRSPLTVLVVLLAFGLWLGQLIWAVRLARAEEATTTRPFLRSSVVFYVAAWILTIVMGRAIVRPFLVEGFKIPQNGMAPTLVAGDHLFAVKLGSGFDDPRRGDIIVFRDHPKPGYDFVQRVIAKGGDSIEIRGGDVLVNGKPLVRHPCENRDFRYKDYDQEQLAFVERTGRCYVETSADNRSYRVLQGPRPSGSDHPASMVPEGHVFVLGDNRDNSFDSRSWGTVPVSSVIGIAKRIWWSKPENARVRWGRISAGL